MDFGCWCFWCSSIIFGSISYVKSKESGKVKSRFVWIGVTAAVAIIIALVVLIVVTLNKETPVTTSPESPTQISRTLSGKTAAEDRADVLAAATKLLDATNAPMGATDYANLMDEIDKGNVNPPQGLFDQIRLVDNLAEDTTIKNTLYQSLVTFAALSKQSTGTEKITTLYDNAVDAITLDQETGIAYVPTTLFINSSSGVNGFSLEFVYVDGEWIFSPYMTLDELRLALVYSGGIQQSPSN